VLAIIGGGKYHVKKGLRKEKLAKAKKNKANEKFGKGGRKK
jgi:hypothetical protein